MKFGAQRQYHSDGIALYVTANHTRGVLEAATGFSFIQVQEGEVFEPSIRLTNQEAQELVNELYAAGIHPTQAAGSAGQLDATRKHLEDMRSLVFKKAPQ